MEFEGYKNIVQLVVLLEMFVIFHFYRRNPKISAYVTLISIALKGQYLWIGKPIYAWYASACLSLIYLLANKKQSIKLHHSQSLDVFQKILFLYFFYTILISLVMWFVYSVEGKGTDATAVSASRIFTQIFYFILLLGLYEFGKNAGREITTINLLKSLIIIAVVVGFFAVFQVVVVTFTGVNLFPIIGSDDSLRSAYILDKSFRATSFAGEPKHLGMIMSIGLTMFFLARVLSIYMGKFFKFYIPLVMIAALLLSLSATGIFLTIVGILIIGIVFFSKIPKLKIVVSILCIIAFQLAANVDLEFLSSLDSQVSKNGLEVQDQSVSSALFDNPIFLFAGTGLGNIHLLAVNYLPPDFPLFKDHGYKANSGFFFVVGDSGLIGMILLVLAVFCIFEVFLKLRGRLDLENSKESVVAISLLLISLINFILRYDVIFFFISGFVLSRFSVLRTKSLGNPPTS